jgi:hypothetical protein
LIFHYKCPHCHAVSHAECEDWGVDMVLPTPYPLSVGCSDCGAQFVVDFHVRERPRVSVLTRMEMVAIRQEGRKLAPILQRYKREHVHSTPPPVSCPGCDREYGEVAGYPDPLPKTGLCAVCSQELARLLAVRKAGRR